MQAKMRPQDETYAETENIVHSAVNAFWRKYGGDKDELLSAAHEAWVKAYKRFSLKHKVRPGNYHFGGWLQRIVYYALLDANKARCNRRFQPFSNLEDITQLTADGDVAGEEAIADDRKPSLQARLDQVSTDAQQIAYFALDRLGDPANSISLFQSVAAELGWGFKRFWKAVTEIREVIAL